MNALAVTLGCLAVFLCFLAVERVRHERRLRKIPLRICVTGTRGKSTVTRLVAAALRESGRRVVAKTTGSKPVVILPNGSETEIVRPGTPTILEQKKVVHLARRFKADVLVAEMMSIRPENLRVESSKLFKPQVLVLTNVRLDHMDDMGRTKEDIATSLAAAIPGKGALVTPEKEFYPAFERIARQRAAKVVRVRKGSAESFDDSLEFEENRNLALAVADYCGVPSGTALRGLAAARPDFGSLKIWKIVRSGRVAFFASAFAANEPESSAQILSMVRKRAGLPTRAVGLLNLRADRGDRTRQWLEAARAGFFDEFDRLVFIGDHARALSRRSAADLGTKARVASIPLRDPGRITDSLFALSDEDALVVGLGNMGGPGAALVEYWARVGAEA